MLSDEEVIANVKQVMEALGGKYIARYKFAAKVGASPSRLARMERLGMIKLPPKLPNGVTASIAAKKSKWRNFELKGSPKNKGRQKPTKVSGG